MSRFSLAALGLSALVFLAACGGSSGGGAGVTINAASGGSVVSDDGLLTLEVPPGALTDDTKISIEAVEIDDLPRDAADGADGEVAYRLEPDGLEFSEPATVMLRFDIDDVARLSRMALSSSRFSSFSRGRTSQSLLRTSSLACQWLRA